MSEDMKQDPKSELTARQRQILDLMQAGKVNKEIATTLGIGVGTVKQHIVALFKKLNVSNRTMAVSRSMELQQEQDKGSATKAAGGAMERRPCVVLSIALPEEADPRAVRLLHGIMAALAFDNDALFLARKGNAGDIIFGVQRVTEYDLLKALQTAHSVFGDLSALDGALAADLRGGMTAGLAGASMHRYGGWTGEAIASAAIAASRDLATGAVAGHLAIGQPARDLMQAFGIGGNTDVSGMVVFPMLDSVRWTGERSAYGLMGRHVELAELTSALAEAEQGRGRLVYLEGETGMGKSRLCKEVSALCSQRGGQVSFYRCQPAVSSSNDLLDMQDGSAHSTSAVIGMLDAPATDFPSLLVVDDFHLLPQEKQFVLKEAAEREAAKGRLVILSGRRSADRLFSQPESIQLGRLQMGAVEALVLEVLGDKAAQMRRSGVQAIARMAAGVPLFAVEMARHFGDEAPALPLLVVICARLDNLRLDRELLRHVARSDGCLTQEKAAAKIGMGIEAMAQSVELAVASGVLKVDGDGCLAFTHPLLRQVIDFLGME